MLTWERFVLKKKKDIGTLNRALVSYPTDMSEKVTAIQHQASKIKDDIISEQEVCSKIMIAAPKMYIQGIRAMQIAQDAAMMVDHLEKEMCEMYHMFHLQEDETEDSDSDEDTKNTALTTPETGWAKFKCKCYHCNKSGHRAHQCPEKKSQESNEHGNEKESENPTKFKGTCNGCKNMGIASQSAGETREARRTSQQKSRTQMIRVSINIRSLHLE